MLINIKIKGKIHIPPNYVSAVYLTLINTPKLTKQPISVKITINCNQFLWLIILWKKIWKYSTLSYLPTLFLEVISFSEHRYVYLSVWIVISFIIPMLSFLISFLLSFPEGRLCLLHIEQYLQVVFRMKYTCLIQFSSQWVVFGV